MEVDEPKALLGGMSPAAFMRRHWQKKPLLVRQAIGGVAPPLTRGALFDLAARQGVESRLVLRHQPGAWQVRNGPVPRRALPPVARPGWTLLVQGLDRHVPAAHALLQRFRFVPDARLDDLMVSWASAGGGVGAHVDSYDVFLLQVQGQRRWRVGKVGGRPVLDEAAPLKLLRHFEPTDDWLLEPGDLLYVPPGWGHDGTAGEGGDCMTCSIGFRAPDAATLARELLLRLADQAAEDDGAAPLYRDPGQPATAAPAALPPALLSFAQQALQRLLDDPQALPRAVGELLSEPHAQAWFEQRSGAVSERSGVLGGVRLDAATRMLYDDAHVFINGEAFVAAGRDARLMRQLADARRLSAQQRRGLGKGAAALLQEWLDAGWLQAEDRDE